MMRMALLSLTLLATSAVAETPAEIAQELSRDHPHVAELLREHPEILTVWQEDFWADALLRSPVIPGTSWRTHDLRRPQPQSVRPAMKHCRGPKRPPGGSVLLARGEPLGFSGEKLNLWTLDSGILTSSGHTNNRIGSNAAYGNVQIHLEFRMPSKHPIGAWQYRGNSGVFLMGLYEVQILDSWKNPTYPDGAIGALYGQKPPDIIASLPPGHWQCMDIDFVAPQFVGGVLAAPARVSVKVNGILVQDQSEFLGPTAFGVLTPYAAHENVLPFTLQDHGDLTSRVSFRNIWVSTAGGKQ